LPTPGIKHSGFRGLRAFQPATTFVTVDTDSARNRQLFIPPPLWAIARKTKLYESCL